MDAIIRFCFLIEPEILDDDEYAKIYGQAKYIWDFVSVASARRAANEM